MRKYDYSFLKKGISMQVFDLATIIYDLKSKEDMRKTQHEKTFENLKDIAIVESIKGSNAIEGIVTSDARLKEIANGNNDFISHSEKEIAGYRDILNEIHNNYSDIEINKNYILRMHELLFKYSSNNEKGMFKSKDNYIIELLKDGTRRIRFIPTKAKDVNNEIEQLLLAFYEARQDSAINPLLLIPCFILDFLCIHPFLDGNGRISRLLTILLLYQNGFEIVKYVSLENKINKYKDAYYISLEDSSMKWHENENDYVPFIINFFQTLYQCYKELDEKFVRNTVNKLSKNKRVEEVVLNSITPISKSEISDRLSDVSIQTIENTLSRLLNEKKIIKIGNYKSAKYYKK